MSANQNQSAIYANSFDLDKTPSNSVSHTDPSCLTLRQHFHQRLSDIIQTTRAPDKVRNLISIMHISSPNPMFKHLLGSSQRDDFNKFSNIEFGEEVTHVVPI